MKCFTCHTRMECYDDVNEVSVRIDWYKCPKCNSKAEVEYGEHGEYIKKVIWER